MARKPIYVVVSAAFHFYSAGACQDAPEPAASKRRRYVSEKLSSGKLLLGRLARFVAAILLAAFGAAAFSAFAEDTAYPNRPITMIVTFPAGGRADLFARARPDPFSPRR